MYELLHMRVTEAFAYLCTPPFSPKRFSKSPCPVTLAVAFVWSSLLEMVKVAFSHQFISHQSFLTLKGIGESAVIKFLSTVPEIKILFPFLKSVTNSLNFLYST